MLWGGAGGEKMVYGVGGLNGIEKLNGVGNPMREGKISGVADTPEWRHPQNGDPMRVWKAKWSWGSYGVGGGPLGFEPPPLK